MADNMTQNYPLVGVGSGFNAYLMLIVEMVALEGRFVVGVEV